MKPVESATRSANRMFEDGTITAEQRDGIIRRAQEVEARGGGTIMDPSDKRPLNVYVNGRAHTLTAGPISYALLVALAGKAVVRFWTVTWHARGENRGGTLAPGQSVMVEDGMIFNVVDPGGGA